MNRQQSDEQNLLDENQSPKKLIKTKVGLSNAELLSLTTNQCKFNQKIDKLNKVGVHYIQCQRYAEALVYLSQAQKILQYAASCGKTIDRYLITTTLQNQACAYQRLWELEKSADYMEAIIYNLNSYIQSLNTVQFNDSLKEKKSSNYHNLNNFISRRLDGVFYYLQFSAVSSQINEHQNSINSVNEALDNLKTICNDCLKYEKILKGKNSSLIEELMRNFDIRGHRLRTLLLETKQALDKIEKTKNKKIFNFDHKVLEGFMIGEVMQVGPLTMDEAKQKNSLDEEISEIGIVYKVFYLSICYFVLGTQLRLLTKEKYAHNYIDTTDYKKSKIYHLFGIKIIASMIPYTSQYLRHIVKSFHKNYDIDLYSLEEDIHDEQISSIEIESIVNSQTVKDRLTQELRVRKIEDQQNETLKRKNYQEKTKGETFFSEVNIKIPKKRKDLQEKIVSSKKNKKKKIPRNRSNGKMQLTETKICINSPKKSRFKQKATIQYYSNSKRSCSGKKSDRNQKSKEKTCERKYIESGEKKRRSKR